MAERNRFVIDTNVLAVAEGLHGGASERCRASCADMVRTVQEQAVVVLDDGDRIAAEYVCALEHSPYADAGKKFAQWVWRNRWDATRFDKVTLTPSNDAEGSFVEFPADESLNNFDADDRKFVAAACVHPARPAILEALDEGWYEFREALARNGVDIQFLCLSDLEAKA